MDGVAIFKDSKGLVEWFMLGEVLAAKLGDLSWMPGTHSFILLIPMLGINPLYQER